MKKGSAEAKAWGARMRRLRNAANKGRKTYNRVRTESNMASGRKSPRRSGSRKRVNIRKNDFKLAGVALVGAVIGYVVGTKA